MTAEKMHLISKVLEMSDEQFDLFIKFIEAECGEGQLPGLNLSSIIASA